MAALERYHMIHRHLASPATESRRAVSASVATVAVGVMALAASACIHPPAAAAVPIGITGYAGDQGVSCNSCHGGGAPPEVRLEGPRHTVTAAAEMFRFTVSSRSEQQTVAGFDIAADAGIFEAISGEGAKAEFGELTHAAPKANVSAEASWQFLWRAPRVPGLYTLYASGLSANDRRDRPGDGSAQTSFVVEVAPGPCTGDCNRDGKITVDELVRGVNIFLALAPAGDCPLFDSDGDGRMSIAELTAAVANSLLGCGHELRATPTASSSPTRTPLPTRATPGTPVVCVSRPGDGTEHEWRTYGGSHSRTFYNPEETRITRRNVGTLRPKWRYRTGAIITASPVVAYVDVPGEGRVKVVFVSSWDGNFYALRAANGTRLWHYAMKPHPGGSFPYAGSAEVAEAAGELRVFVAGGMTLYALNAATGELRWAFDAGTGCSDCGPTIERNEIESSPAVIDGMVLFGMDVNDNTPGKGGTYAVDAADGTLVWYFDLETGSTCRPNADDEIRAFDGFQDAALLGLADDFFATRPGCDFDRTPTACGNVWSSFAVDPARRSLYIASSNCDTDEDPSTPEPFPPMPPYDAAIFSLDFDGNPDWVWRPRDIDNADFAFGAVPNLFATEIAGTTREVVGIGNKDGTYYVLDRDGVNRLTGRIEPYWQTRVVPGGAIGGIIGTPAVGEGKIMFSTAIGWDISRAQKPAAFGLRATDGEILWSNAAADPSYAAASAIPGVVFMGSLFSMRMYAYDSDSGERLFVSRFLGGPLASSAAVVDGEVFIGTGVGQRSTNPDSLAHIQSLVPSDVTAFCLADACDCPEELCDDNNPCTFDFHSDSGCESEDLPDGVRCRLDEMDGTCAAGTCIAS